MTALRQTIIASSSCRGRAPSILLLLWLAWLLLYRWPGLSVAGQQRAGDDSRALGSARWITPVTLLSVPSLTGPGVRLG